MTFDAAYALPPPEGRMRGYSSLVGSPALGTDAVKQLQKDLEISSQPGSRASMGRRLLLVSSLELEEEEVEERMCPAPISATRGVTEPCACRCVTAL